MPSHLIRHQIEQGIAVIELDNPPLNLLTVPMTKALDEILETLSADPSVRALVICGAGDRAFCAGSDIGEFDRYMKPRAGITDKLYVENLMYTRLARFPWPTVAAVQGVAYGGGLELAACCDLIVAEKESCFALPEVHLGVFPGSGGTVRVTRRIGPGRAKEMIFLGEPIDAATALAWGLLNRVVPTGKVLAEAKSLAEKLARGPSSLRLAKTAVDMAFDLPEEDAVARMLPLMDSAFTSDDCREGVAAFREKRQPNFESNTLLDKTK